MVLVERAKISAAWSTGSLLYPCEKTCCLSKDNGERQDLDSVDILKDRPAITVIPTPIVYIKVAVVKSHVFKP